MDNQDQVQERLELQASQIERVFAEHRVDAQVLGGYHTVQRTSFDLLAQLGAGWDRLRRMTDDLLTALRVPSVHLYREDGRLRLEVVQPTPAAVELFDLLALIPPLPPATALLGLADDGEPVLLRFDDEEVAHVLVAGCAGAGKSALLRTLALSLALHNRQAQLQLVVVDPVARSGGGDSLRPLDYVPHMMMPVVPTVQAAAEALRFLADEAHYRLQRQRRQPRIVIVIDELDALLAADDGVTLEALAYLLQNGLQAGMQLVLATRQPRAPALDHLLKTHLTVRLVGRVQDSAESRAATGIRDAEAELLLGQGDFVAVTPRHITYFQGAYSGDYDFRHALQQINRRRGPALVAQPVGLRPQFTPQFAARTRAVPPQAFAIDPRTGAARLDQPDEPVEFGGRS